MNDVRLNSIGTRFNVTILQEHDGSIYSLSGLTVTFNFWKPNGSVLSKTATLLDNGENGVCYYISQSGDLNALGLWRLQANVIGVDKDYPSDIGDFRVLKNAGSE